MARNGRAPQHVTDFRKTQPLNGEPASHATEAWILSTPEGLAVAFRNTQPASVPRTQQRVQRDFEEQVDRVNVMVDFDGDGRTGYNFRVSSTDGIYDGVITDESQFNKDWDGNWKHAVGEDDAGWTVEVLIPWHIAPMREAKGDKRTLKIYLDRVIGTTGERVAWPQASLERPRFLSDFAPIEVASHSQSLLAVTPYVSGLYDNVGESSDGDAGVDVFWKPNGQMQLTATVNPDFGQVESDDLVVNFGATETFISDKRPFFTENQGIFEFTTPSDFSQLLYTRRVGGPADDGEGSGDITAALKLNGSVGATKYGVFAADEARVGRPHVQRAARGARFRDAEPRDSWRRTSIVRTSIARPPCSASITTGGPPRAGTCARACSAATSSRPGQARSDTGATVWADYEMDHGWRQQWIAHAFRQRPADQRRRLSVAQQHQLPALAGESPLHRPAGDFALRLEGLALARQHRLQRSRAAAEPPVPHEPREPAAQRQLRIRPDQRQQRRRRRPDHARQRRAQAAAQLQQLFRLPAAAQGQLGLRSRSSMRTAAASRATARWATA